MCIPSYICVTLLTSWQQVWKFQKGEGERFCILELGSVKNGGDKISKSGARNEKGGTKIFLKKLEGWTYLGVHCGLGQQILIYLVKVVPQKAIQLQLCMESYATSFVIFYKLDPCRRVRGSSNYDLNWFMSPLFFEECFLFKRDLNNIRVHL